MEIKKNVPNNTITRDLNKLAEPTGNVYESIVIISKRANQISAELKQELNQKLEEFSNYADTLEETFENREQIEISRYYEKLPKPSLLAISEFEESKIYHRKIEG
ncbi:MAG: DNA-directed RNA polymerase subunit omega [Bacteroidales bacterium]|jgi:DNA-directed RNA polymerase subunit K/omega